MKTATAVLAIVAAGTFAAAVTALPAHGVPADDPTDLIPGLLPDDQSATPPPADGTFATGLSQATAWLHAAAISHATRRVLAPLPSTAMPKAQLAVAATSSLLIGVVAYAVVTSPLFA